MCSRMRCVLAVVPLLVWSATAAPVEHVTCPDGPYHVQPFTLVIDQNAGTIEASGAVPEPQSVVIGPTQVEWSFMRGWAVFHRDTHMLEWDATSQYEYGRIIGHPGPHGRDWYVGKSVCAVK